MKPQSYTFQVTQNEWLSPTVFQLSLTSHAELSFQAGQFLSILIPASPFNEKPLRRAYSIASPPEQKTLELCIKKTEKGPGSGYLASLKQGDSLTAMASYGDFIYRPSSLLHVYFVSTGTGLAPFRSILKSQAFQDHAPRGIHCLCGVRYDNELLYTADLTQHVKNIDLVYTVSQPSASWNGYTGRVTDYFKSLQNQFSWQDSTYYLCGHGDMIREIKTFLLDQGVEKKCIFQEIYYQTVKN